MKRDKWSSKLGFILAAAGSAVGLGNIWKFPYTVGTNGGGAFVFLYLIFLLIVGLPLTLAAITLGRKTQRSVRDAYGYIDKRWKFAGNLGIICGFFILAFYSTVGGWVLFYLKKSIFGQLNLGNKAEFEIIFGGLMNSPRTLILYQFIFMLMTISIVLKGINKGIEKASSIMMPSLFLLLIIIAIRSLTLTNSLEGLRYLFVPDFQK